MEELYYPKVEMRIYRTEHYGSDNPYWNHITLITNLRKKHTNGKWYLFRFFKAGTFTTTDDYPEFINRFHKEVYLADKLGTVVPDAPNLLFPEDNLQIEEDDRLRRDVIL